MFPGLVTDSEVSTGSGLGSWLQLPWIVGRISVPSVVPVDFCEAFWRRLWHCL